MDIRDEIDYLEDRLPMMRDLADTLTEDIEVIEKNIKELKEKLREEEREKERWEPKYGDEFYFIGPEGTVHKEGGSDFDWNQRLLAVGNCFKTEEEDAKIMVNRLKARAKFLKYGGKEGHIDGVYTYLMPYSKGQKILPAEFTGPVPVFGIWFDSKEDCQKAIDSLTEEEKAALCEVH